MRGGSLSRYHTPQVGRGLTEELIKVAGPVILDAGRAGLQSIQGGQTWQQGAKNAGKSLARGAKRKAPTALAKVAGTSSYKKAARRVKDIFD